LPGDASGSRPVLRSPGSTTRPAESDWGASVATIDAEKGNDHRGAGNIRPGGVTVHEMHHQVCTARVRQCPPGRVHHSRRHLPVSHYRARGHFQINGDSGDVLPRDSPWSRRSMLTVLASMAAVGLVYLALLQILLPPGSQRLLLGVLLVAIAGAVVLNAMTVEAMDSPRGTGDRSMQS
jgi:hypothetical protein